MYSTYIESTPVIPERFIKTLTAKICKKMTANDRKSYLSYLNKLVDQYNNNYHYSVNEKSINTDYSAMTEKIQSNPKAPKFKVNNRILITKDKDFFSKVYTENWSRELILF